LQGYTNPIAEKLFYLLGLFLFCWMTERWLYPKLSKKRRLKPRANADQVLAQKYLD